ncbi:MAG: hypothetical protein NDI82_13465 [Anaeromyxobacteraceae bacterium]|nr:hypothetical protein [Anaeromyxobacteraceae bacterium]
MSKLPLLLALSAAALLPSVAEAARPPASPAAAPAAAQAPADPAWTLGWELTAAAGGFSGQGTRTDAGGLLVIDAGVEPTYASGALTLKLPASLAHRQTVGASLSETRARAAVEPTWRVGKTLKLGAEAGLTGVLRPDWPDQYQRVASGDMPGTDRYSHLEWRAGANLYAQPAPHQHLRLRYRLESVTYRRDPAFDPATPMHLTPRDHVKHLLQASWRRLQPTWALALRLDAAFRRDSVYLARRAGSGGSSGNPEQSLNDYEPSVEVELRRLGGLADLSLRYGREIRVDTFQGYYSFTGHHPEVKLEAPLGPGIEGRLSLEAWLRTYGPDSKANTEDGARLEDRKVRAAATLEWALRDDLALVASASWTHRTTNYPDYVPGVYPATRFYEIAWDYDNVAALAGVRWRR